MSGDRSRTREQLAADCFALAQQTFDATLRASLVGMAQKWLDLAELGPQEQDEAPVPRDSSEDRRRASGAV